MESDENQEVKLEYSQFANRERMVKAKTYSTTLKDLYGVDGYAERIKVGDEFWTDALHIENLTGKKWNKVKVSYVRSGIVFFNVVGEELPEQYFPIDSFDVAMFIKARLDPYKDLEKMPGLDRCRFDDRLTEVVNFDNRENKEVPDELLI